MKKKIRKSILKLEHNLTECIIIDEYNTNQKEIENTREKSSSVKIKSLKKDCNSKIKSKED